MPNLRNQQRVDYNKMHRGQESGEDGHSSDDKFKAESIPIYDMNFSKNKPLFPKRELDVDPSAMNDYYQMHVKHSSNILSNFEFSKESMDNGENGNSGSESEGELQYKLAEAKKQTSDAERMAKNSRKQDLRRQLDDERRKQLEIRRHGSTEGRSGYIPQGWDIGQLRKDKGVNKKVVKQLRDLNLDCLLSDSDDELLNVQSKTFSGLAAKQKHKVKKPQLCPQSMLQLEYVVSDIKFSELTFSQFIAGETEIIRSPSTHPIEKIGRLALMNKIAYLYETYEWKALLNYYAAFIRRIEHEQNTWEDDSSFLETSILAGYLKSKAVKGRMPIANSGYAASPRVWFCSDYQRQKCLHNGAHQKTLNGVSRNVHHVCATCLVKNRVSLNHPESSSACPHFGTADKQNRI